MLLTPLLLRDPLEKTIPAWNIGRLTALASALPLIPAMYGVINSWIGAGFWREAHTKRCWRRTDCMPTCIRRNSKKPSATENPLPIPPAEEHNDFRNRDRKFSHGVMPKNPLPPAIRRKAPNWTIVIRFCTNRSLKRPACNGHCQLY